MDKAGEEASGTQALDRAARLLRLVASATGRGARLADLIAQSGLSKPTAHRLLRALERLGLVDQDPGTRLYHLGPEAFVIGALAAERFGIHRVALPSLARLASASEDTAFLSVRRDWHAVCLHREEGTFPIRTHVLNAGDRHPLGVGAGSLAILAALPANEAEAAIAASTEEIEARYPAISAALLRDLVAQTRERGYALNPGLLMAGSWGVGVPVLNREGRCEGALSIAAIEARLGEARQQEMAALLKAEAHRLAERLAKPAGASGLSTPSSRRQPAGAGASRNRR